MPSIQISGLTNQNEIQKVIDLGVDYLGFAIDEAQNSSSLSIYSFCNLIRNLDKGNSNTQIVVELKNPLKTKIDQLIETGLVNVLEFKGEEDSFFLSEFYFQIEVWKLFEIKSTDKADSFLQKLEKYKHSSRKFVLEINDQQKEKIDEGIFYQASKFGYDLALKADFNTDNIYDYLTIFKPEMVSINLKPSENGFDLGKLQEFVAICKNWRG